MAFFSKKSPSTPSDKQTGTLVAAGFQITIIVGIFVIAGHWLDAKNATAPWCMLGGSIVGIGLGLYLFLAPYLKK